MSPALKPIKLYSHAFGPNPWKVAIIMEELNIPYVSEYIDFFEIKKVNRIDYIENRCW